MSDASDRDWRLWFLGGPAPEHEYGSDDTDPDVDPDRQWWRAAHRDPGAGPPYWVVDQRALVGRMLEDAMRDPSEARDLLGFLPERLLSPLNDKLAGGLSTGLRRLGPGRNAPASDVAAAGAISMVLVDGRLVTALEWRADGHVVVGFAWDGRLVAAIRPDPNGHTGQDPPGVRFAPRGAR